MPVRNEAAHLERAVAAILAQEYRRAFDICLAIAPSTDGTEALAAAIAATEPRVNVVDNPAGVTPAGLNRAIAATTGSIVVRVDGHAALSPGYIRRAVETMRRTGAVNVGGVQAARGETTFERAVATAMTSPIGSGGARFHLGGDEGAVDTVYLGVFDRAAGDAVGWFDESLHRNQDYELNIRLRQAGGVVWFDPELSVEYRPRGNPLSLAGQYYQYGLWKAEVVMRHPRSLKARQFAPAAHLVLQILALSAARRSKAALVLPAAYAAAVVVASRRAAAGEARQAVRVSVATIIMHQAWGAGALRGLARAVAIRLGRHQPAS